MRTNGFDNNRASNRHGCSFPSGNTYIKHTVVFSHIGRFKMVKRTPVPGTFAKLDYTITIVLQPATLAAT